MGVFKGYIWEVLQLVYHALGVNTFHIVQKNITNQLKCGMHLVAVELGFYRRGGDRIVHIDVGGYAQKFQVILLGMYKMDSH